MLAHVVGLTTKKMVTSATRGFLSEVVFQEKVSISGLCCQLLPKLSIYYGE